MKKNTAKKYPSRGRTNSSLKLLPIVILGASLITGALVLGKLTSSNQSISRLTAEAAGNRWESGASCKGIADGTFGTWRGSPMTIAGTWNDASLAVQKEQWSMSSGGEYKNWTESVDNAVGAFWGSNWQAAARGDHDANLRTALQVINNGWGNKKTVYLRYAHEFNGDWYQWKVTPADNEYFKQASIRFYNLVQTELVAKGRDAKVAWAPNSGEHNGINTELHWPGDQYIDVIAVDYYDWDVLNTQAKWDANFMKKGSNGGPYGIGAWQDFARRHGKPLAFSEWGTSGEKPTENPFFIQKMNEFMTANAGNGPGQVVYDVYFNCTGYGGSGGEKFQIFPNTVLPQTAAKYKSLKWGSSIIASATPTLAVIDTPTTGPTALPTVTSTIPTPTNTPVPTVTPTPTPAAATPIVYRSATSGNNGSSSRTITLTKPSGVVTGDIMIAQIAVLTASTTITPPSGWKLIRSNQTSGSMKMSTYYKFASTLEPASYNWSFNATRAATGGISAFGGVHATNPIQASSGKYNDSTATISFTQVNASVANGLVLAFVSVSGNTTVTPPLGYNEYYDRNNTASSSNGKTVEISSQIKTNTGSTNVPSTREDSLTKSNLTQVVVLRPR